MGDARSLLVSVLKEEFGLIPLPARLCRCGRRKDARVDLCIECRRLCPLCGGRKSLESEKCMDCHKRTQDSTLPQKFNGGHGRPVSDTSETVRLGLSVTREQYERFLELARHTGMRRSELLGGFIDSEYEDMKRRAGK